MIAIETKYIPASNYKPSRIKATANGMSATIGYPHELSNERVHFAAVKALVAKHKLNWKLDNMRFGGTAKGYVFCFADSIVEQGD